MQPMRGPQQRPRPQNDLLDISSSAAASAAAASGSSPSKDRRSSNSLMVDLEDSVTGAVRKGHEAAITVDPIRVIVFSIIIVSLIFFTTLGPSLPSPPQHESNGVDLGSARGSSASKVSSAFLNSCASSDRRSFEAILDRYGRDLTTGDKLLCMHYALQDGGEGYLDIVSTLLSMGVDPVVVDPTGVSLLEVSCTEGRVEAFRMMLRRDTRLCSSQGADSLYYFAGRAPSQGVTKQLIETIREQCDGQPSKGKLGPQAGGADKDLQMPGEVDVRREGRSYESEWSEIASKEKYSKEVASLQIEVEKWRDRAFDAARQKQQLLDRVARLEAQLEAKEVNEAKSTATPRVEPPERKDDEYERLWRDSKFVDADKPLTGGPANELISSPLPPPEGRKMFLT